MTQVTTTHELEHKLYGEISNVLEASLPAIDVLAVELLGSDRFCVYVDHPDGIDHELCSEVTNALSIYLRDFAIDVSSPGINRPLRHFEHFMAVVGKKVSIRSTVDHDGQRKFKGIVSRVTDSHVLLEMNCKSIEIAYETISRANLMEEER